jgi:WD40 repeat protein
LDAVSPDASGVTLWDVASGRRRYHLEGQGGVGRAVAFTPDGRMLACQGSGYAVGVWEVATGKQRRRFAGHEAWIHALAFSPDGRWLASGSEDATALLWDLAKPGAGNEPAVGP